MKTIKELRSLSKEKLIEYFLELQAEKEKIEAEFYALQKKHNELLIEKDNLLEKNKLRAIQIFARKTEKNNDPTIINEAEETIASTRGRRKGEPLDTTNYLHTHYTKEIILYPDEYSNIGSDPNVIKVGEDYSYKVDYIPGKYEIIRFVKPKYFDKVSKRFYQAISDDIFPHSYWTSSLASFIFCNKFLLGLPYYRQEKYILNKELNITRLTMCNLQTKASEILEPLYNHFKRTLLATPYKVICADETTLKVIDLKKTCYAWLYTTSFYDNPIYVYEFCKTREKENVKAFLNGYEGYLLSDAYSAYFDIEGVTNALCWAHARRKFIEIVKTLSADQINESVAQQVINLMQPIFEKEAKFKEELLLPSQIKEARNKEDYANMVNEVFKYVKNVNPQKGSALERAINYLLKHENLYKTYLQDGHIDMTNNISERAIKPFVIDRKNFLFSINSEGAKSSLIIFTLIQNARTNGIDPEAYIKYCLDNLKPDMSEEEFNEFLPWNLKENKIL